MRLLNDVESRLRSEGVIVVAKIYADFLKNPSQTGKYEGHDATDLVAGQFICYQIAPKSPMGRAAELNAFMRKLDFPKSDIRTVVQNFIEDSYGMTLGGVYLKEIIGSVRTIKRVQITDPELRRMKGLKCDSSDFLEKKEDIFCHISVNFYPHEGMARILSEDE